MRHFLMLLHIASVEKPNNIWMFLDWSVNHPFARWTCLQELIAYPKTASFRMRPLGKTGLEFRFWKQAMVPIGGEGSVRQLAKVCLQCSCFHKFPTASQQQVDDLYTLQSQALNTQPQAHAARDQHSSCSALPPPHCVNPKPPPP